MLQSLPLFFSMRSSRMGQCLPPICAFESNYKTVASDGEPWGFTCGNSWWGSTDQKKSFSTPVFRPSLKGRNCVIITQIRAQTKNFFKCISNSPISISFLFMWNWNDKYVHRLPWFPRKPYPIPDQNGQSVYPISDQKAQSFRATHT